DAQSHFHSVLLTPDDGGAPRGLDARVFRLLASAHESPSIGEITIPPPANAVGVPAAMETVTPMSAGVAMRQATDAVFTSSPRTHTPAQGGGWEIEELELGLFSTLPMEAPSVMRLSTR